MKCGIIEGTLCTFGVVAAVLVAGADVRSSGEQGTDEGLRTNHAIGYYDAALKRVVLVAGESEPKDGERDRLWSWSGSRWEPLTNAGPPGSFNSAAAYDSRQRRGIVTGGARRSAGGRYAPVGDVWVGAPGGWLRMTDIGPRDHHSLVEDGRGRLLMFGGTAGPERWLDDTWLADDGRWTRVATDGPSARARTAMVYDSKRRRVTLFGGVSAPPGPQQPQTFLGDTWQWDGSRWHKVAETGPRGRYAHGMVFDERAGVVLLYSGAAAHRNAPLSDMWQWDGERWTEIALSGPTPGPRYQPVMIYDRARGRTVLYGGAAEATDTWEWDGRRWHQVQGGTVR